MEGSPLAGSTKGCSSEGRNCGFRVGIRQHHCMVLGSHVCLHTPPCGDISSITPETGPPVQYLQGAHHPQMEGVSIILGAGSLHHQGAMCRDLRLQGQPMPCDAEVSGHLDTFAAGRASLVDVAACSV